MNETTQVVQSLGKTEELMEVVDDWYFAYVASIRDVVKDQQKRVDLVQEAGRNRNLILACLRNNGR